MDIIIAAAMLLVAVGVLFKRPIRVEVTHRHVVEGQETKDLGITDPNEVNTDPEIERNMTRIIQDINAIMNGGEPYIERE